MKLNLGCGVFPFPRTPDDVPNPEHTLPVPDEVYEPGWVNVDKFQSPGVQEKIDLFRFPWVRSSNGSPFNDNSADYIWAAHIVEHIPHQVRLAAGLPGGLAGEYRALVEDMDGFFVFFHECWRILKPGGLMHIRFPYGASYGALNDPTHTRYLTPATFSYLKPPTGTAPFDYQVPCHFELEGEYIFRIEPSWAERLQRLNNDAAQDEMRENYASVQEVRLTMRAVKG